MRGQSEIVGSVLVVGILVGAMAAAYTWGVPLLSKSQSANRIKFMQDFFEKGADNSLSVVREGGQVVLSGTLQEGTLELEKDKTDEYVLTYNIMTNLQYFPESGTPLNDYNSPYKINEVWITPGETTTDCAGSVSALSGEATFDEFTTEEETKSFKVCSDGTLDFDDAIYNVGDAVPGKPKWVIVSVENDSVGFQDGWANAEGVLGKSEAFVIIGESQKLGSNFKTMLTIKPREIYDASRGETVKVEFVPLIGESNIARGTFKLTFKYSGEEKIQEGNRTKRVVTLGVGLG